MSQEILPRIDVKYLELAAPRSEVLALQEEITSYHEKLSRGAGADELLGWIDPLSLALKELRHEIRRVAAGLRQRCKALVCIGIGGSYLGSRAAIGALAGESGPRVLFAGQNLSADYHRSLLSLLGGAPFAINVISKSGTTTEPAIAFRILKAELEKRVPPKEAAGLIVVTTDASRGALRQMANSEGYQSFVIPETVGGRYSVLSAVGLFPMAFAGIDIDGLVEGAAVCSRAFNQPRLEANPGYYYAAARNVLYRKAKQIEILATFQPRLHYLAEWWKQLFGESEGKDSKSLYPASADFTTDLHSLGQWIQEGPRNIIETFLLVEEPNGDIELPADAADRDGLGYLEGRGMEEVNRAAYEATSFAHFRGGVPNMSILMPRLDAGCLGALFYFLERACSMSAYRLGVNPFNQPGVDAYKDNMFALLGKPGFGNQALKIQEAVRKWGQAAIISFSA